MAQRYQSSPEFSGPKHESRRLSPNRRLTLSQLAEQVAVQRLAIKEFGPGGERDRQQEVLESLLAEFRRRCDRELDMFWLTSHLAPLQAARISADVFQFRVPPSHRPRIGSYVSLAKRLFVYGL